MLTRILRLFVHIHVRNPQSGLRLGFQAGSAE
jgi:hypothetical protein